MKKSGGFFSSLNTTKKSTFETPDQPRIVIYADKKYLLRLTYSLLLCNITTISLGYISMGSRLGISVKLLCGLLFGGSSLFLSCLLIYAIAVILVRGPVLIFDSSGAFELVSVLKIGRLPLGDIVGVRLSLNSFQDLIVFQIRPQSEVWQKARRNSVFVRKYFGLFSNCLWIPIDFLLIEEGDLIKNVGIFNRALRRETSIGHASASDALLISELKSRSIESPISSGDSTAESPANDFSHAPPPPPPSLVPLSSHTLFKRFEAIFRAGQSEEAAQSHADLRKTEKETHAEQQDEEKRNILVKVEAIKKDFRESKMDRLLCDLYLDEICYFSTWAQSSPMRLPSDIINTESENRSAFEDESRFDFRGHKFAFRLTRQESPNADSPLSIYFDGEEVCLLNVRVEIGELAPQNLIKFLPGPWEALVRELFEVCRSQRQSVEEIEMNETQVIEHIENTGELRKRFGLGQD
ncbi:MAG: hypothetical protein IPL83_18775 [Bdellovibrionales bacterium]|nr:hypothetical protein [Bdellovibrionales bacterium]